jgi:phosphoribosylformylglycinamidine cyclo-ligase
MAGFAVGVVEKDRIITSNVKVGDRIIGLGSSGVHSNGFSLARHICFKQEKLDVNDKIDELGGITIGRALLEPTKIYVQSIVKMLASYPENCPVGAMAHITGGGLVGNIPRVLPSDCDAVIDKSSWQVPEIFNYLQSKGPVEEAEMFRVFNMGIGYVVIVDSQYADEVSAKLSDCGESVFDIGVVAKGNGKVVLK